MGEFNDPNGESWKVDLRNAIIFAMAGTESEKERVYYQLGYYYQCYAQSSIFKYMSDNERNLDNIKNNSLWYSAPFKFNDVFDSDISFSEDDIFNSITACFPQTIKIGSSQWKNLRKLIFPQIKGLIRQIEETRRTTGICCFSETDNSLLMWAHYANNHRGICVEYDLMRINQELRFTATPVIYSEKRAEIHSFDINNIGLESIKILINILTSKSPEWSYEKEWRIIRDSGACAEKWDAEKHGALLEMIKPTSIILGCEAQEWFEKEIRKYCEEAKIDLYIMEKDKEKYALNKKPVLQFNAETGQ